MSRHGWLIAAFCALFVAGLACGERAIGSSGNLSAAMAAFAMVAFSLWFVIAQAIESNKRERLQQKARQAAMKEAERARQEAIAEAQRALESLQALHQRHMREVHEKYQQALLELEAKPTDMERRKAALVAGRTYAEVARRLSGQSGRTMFDEAEIQNDIAIRIGNSQAVATPKRSHKCLNCAAPLVHEAKVCRFCDAPVHA